jgi:hypothetical protein
VIAVVPSLHNVCVVVPAADVNTIVGVGFTVIVYVLAVPVHSPIVGVTVIVAVIAAPVKFVAVNDAMSPVPDAAIPIVGSLFVHVNVAPAGVLANAVPATTPPLHTVMFAGTVTVDGVQITAAHVVGLDDVKQPTPVGVTVITTTSPGLSALTTYGDATVEPPTGAPAFIV